MSKNLGFSFGDAPLTPYEVPHDIKELEEIATVWTQDNYMSWLKNGFAELAAETPDCYLAFAPIRLYPLGRYPEQLAVDLSQANQAGLSAVAKIESVLISALSKSTSSSPAFGSLAADAIAHNLVDAIKLERLRPRTMVQMPPVPLIPKI